jgi:hypothetical protein
MADVDGALVGIIEDLIEALELRDAADPDVPRWEADRRVRALEEQLVVRYRRVERADVSSGVAEPTLAGVF